MSNEYVPTTERVRSDYGENAEGTSAARLAAFDRWLVAHDAEVAAKALTDFADAHRMDYTVFMRSDGSSVTIGDLMRETAAALRASTSGETRG